MSMDADTAELLLAEINTMWSTPLSDYEVDIWHRTIRAHLGAGLGGDGPVDLGRVSPDLGPGHPGT